MTQVDMTSAIELFFTQAAELCEAISLPATLHHVAVDNKKTHIFDPVTAIDREIEQKLRAHIKQFFPDHGIIGEEFGAENQEADYVWVLDPIDGTRNFITGLLGWTCLIGLMYQNRPFAGMIVSPMTGERFIGLNGQSYYSGGRNAVEAKTLSTSQCQKLEEAYIHISTLETFKEMGQEKIANALMDRAKLYRLHYDAYGYAMLCAGKIDASLDHGLQLYDIMALIPIIQGAGGYVDYWENLNKVTGSVTYSIIAAATPALGQEIATYFERISLRFSHP